jgi:hypothetical protein
MSLFSGQMSTRSTSPPTTYLPPTSDRAAHEVLNMANGTRKNP